MEAFSGFSATGQGALGSAYKAVKFMINSDARNVLVFSPGTLIEPAPILSRSEFDTAIFMIRQFWMVQSAPSAYIRSGL
jgi:hypothetical protein